MKRLRPLIDTIAAELAVPRTALDGWSLDATLVIT
jgi:hypothetical protein